MAVTVVVGVAMAVPMSVSMNVAVTVAAVERRARRRAHRLVQHVDADADDDQKARGTHPRHLREPDPEAGAEHGVRQPHDDDGRDDVDDRDLGGHHDAAPDTNLPAEKVRDDDELAVPGSERVDDSVGERDGEADEERAEVVAAFDGVHVRGDLGIRAALEFEDVLREDREHAAVLLHDLDCGCLDAGLRHRARCAEKDHQHPADRQHERRSRSPRSPPARPIGVHGFILRTRGSRAEGVRTARLGRARHETGSPPSRRRRRE